MKTNPLPRSFACPHHNVSVILAANHLQKGEREIVGYFYPNGFLGHREIKYSYKVLDLSGYNCHSKRIHSLYGNTAQAAEKLFEILAPKNGA